MQLQIRVKVRVRVGVKFRDWVRVRNRVGIRVSYDEVVGVVERLFDSWWVQS
jgi:hypothetical protein